ncbi:MAG: hypothetical protein AAFY42_04450 [Pseudomonadota bacterium]
MTAARPSCEIERALGGAVAQNASGKVARARMHSFYAFAAGLALFAPVMGQGDDARVSAPASMPAPQCSAPDSNSAGEAATARQSKTPSSTLTSDLSASNPLEALYRSSIANQVRIEQRVTIRITPIRQSNRNNLLAQLPRRGVTGAFEEREMGTCVPVSGIAGVQTGTGNKLLLFLRDQRIVSVNLERGCRARDFYSGFYIERSEDGRLCVKRDQLQSRSGAKCEVERMRRLVKAGE